MRTGDSLWGTEQDGNNWVIFWCPRLEWKPPVKRCQSSQICLNTELHSMSSAQSPLSQNILWFCVLVRAWTVNIALEKNKQTNKTSNQNWKSNGVKYSCCCLVSQCRKSTRYLMWCSRMPNRIRKCSLVSHLLCPDHTDRFLQPKSGSLLHRPTCITLVQMELQDRELMLKWERKCQDKLEENKILNK